MDGLPIRRSDGSAYLAPILPLMPPIILTPEERALANMPMYPAKDWRDGAAQPTQMRRFYFERTNDVSGTSGTGAVAEGVQFSDGRVALRWITDAGMPSSTVIYDTIGDAETIHGHGGGTKVVWVDGG